MDSRCEEVIAVLCQSVEIYPRISLATALGPGSLLLLHLAVEAGLCSSGLDNSLGIFMVDTGYLFPETLELLDQVQNKYKIQIQVIKPTGSSVQYSPGIEELCCQHRKVEPFDRAVVGLQAWITGVQRGQTKTRSSLEIFNEDRKRGLIKICPLAFWTVKEITGAIEHLSIPINQLHSRGYDSIGCTNCTIPGKDREGRWGGIRTECGIHST